MSDYTESELRLIQSRNQSSGQTESAPFSVDQVSNPQITDKPKAKDVDLKGMAGRVNEAAKEQQATAPTVFDTIDRDMPWLKWAGAALGALGVAHVAKSFFDGDNNNPPPSSNTRTEPTFNAETTQSSMTAGEPKIVADPIPVAPKPVTSEVTVPPVAETTANIVPTSSQPKEIPVPTTGEQRPPIEYGETKYNVPTGAPAVVPPANVEVQPVPPTAKEIAAQSAERRAEELHQAKLEQIKAQTEATRAKASVVKDTPAKAAKSAGGTISPTDAALLNNEIKGKAVAEAAAAQQRAIAEAVKPPAAAPVTPQPTAPVAAAPQAAAPVAEAAVPPNAKPAGKWPGGAEGSALQLFGGTKKNLTPGSMASLEMFKEHVGGPLTMPTTGGTIHQINEASKFYEKYTGEPLPRSAEGKLTRIPEEQIAKLHSGIQSELEAAVKGGKLQSLGKGAMAAAALLGLSTAVQAAQKGDFGPLREAGFNIAGPVALGKAALPFLARAAGTGFTAATYAGEAGEANEAQQVAKKFADYERAQKSKK